MNEEFDDFSEVPVLQFDGTLTVMTQCKHCDLIFNNPSHLRKSSHRVTCIYRYQFKYINATNLNERLSMICLNCSEHLTVISERSISIHREKCPGPTIERSSTNAPKLRRISLVHSWETDAIKYGFKVIRVNESGKSRRCLACQQCGRVIHRVVFQSIESHRKICTYQYREVLISTTTIPSQSPPPPPLQEFAEQQFCFICNVLITNDCIDLFETKTNHSMIPVYDLVWKFLGEKPSQRNVTIDEANSKFHCICMDCYSIINEYDLACVTADRLEKQITDKLKETENFYETRHDSSESEFEPLIAEDSDKSSETDESPESVEIIQDKEVVIELDSSDDDDDVVEIVDVIQEEEKREEVEPANAISMEKPANVISMEVPANAIPIEEPANAIPMEEPANAISMEEPTCSARTLQFNEF